MRLTSLGNLGASVLVVCNVGCATPFPPGVTQLHSCIPHGVELSGKQREETVADCAIPTGWELVGIPAGDVQANHLVAIGVDSGLADMLVAGEEQHARWCVVRHVPHDPSKGSEQTTAEASCSDSDFVISEPVHSGANKVTFTVRRGADGRPVLVDIKTQ